MWKIKLLVLISTLAVGFFYTRTEFKKLKSLVKKRDYVSWYELNRIVAIRESMLY